jgi:hypothetical protein
MYKLTFTLKQHTPLIHFQHDQAGATLRATEVKPKLDQFIIQKYGGKEIVKNVHSDWFIGDGDNLALDYKLRIITIDQPLSKPIVYATTNDGKFRPNFPCIFGNVKENEKKVFRICKEQKLEIIVFNSSLREILELEIADFFFNTSFGFRQSKGFGSYFIKDFEANLFSKYYHFKSKRNLDDYENLFLEIDLFYRCLKSGLNIKTKNRDGAMIDKLYLKSLMFMFAKSQNPKEQWDKRTIRHTLYLDDWKYKDDKKKSGVYYGRTNPNGTVQFNASKPNNRNYYDFRDLLGLSTEQDWLFYHDKKITKTVRKTILINENEEYFDIERFQSPIRFKPYYSTRDKCWYVYILTSEIPDMYSGALVNAANSSNSVELTIYPSFIVDDYLQFAIAIFDKSNIEYGGGFSEGNVSEAKIIIDIFSQLKKQTHQNDGTN